MSSASTVLLPFQPSSMSTAQLAAVSFLARYSGRTHALYTYQLARWFAWCQSNGLDPLVGIQRAHVELYIRGLGDAGLMDSSINAMMHAVRGYFRFAHVDGLISADPAVYARLPKVQRDESRTQGLDRLELIRFLRVAQTLTVHHGALAYLLGINALRASEAAAVRIEDYADTLRGHRVLHLVGKGNKPAPCPSPSRCCACWRPAGASAPPGRWCCARSPASRSTAATYTGWSPGSPRPRRSPGTSAPTPCAAPPSPTPSMLGCRCATLRSWPVTPTPAPPSTTTEPAATSTATECTSSPPTSPASDTRSGCPGADLGLSDLGSHEPAYPPRAGRVPAALLTLPWGSGPLAGVPLAGGFSAGADQGADRRPGQVGCSGLAHGLDEVALSR